MALSAVAGTEVAALPAVEPNDYARLVGLHDKLDAALAATGQVIFRDAVGTEHTAIGEPACVTRFEMLSKGTNFTSTNPGDNVSITVGGTNSLIDMGAV